MGDRLGQRMLGQIPGATSIGFDRQTLIELGQAHSRRGEIGRQTQRQLRSTNRGADAIASQGKARKAKNAKLFASLEAQYGVPAGVLLAIHGMETGFGSFMGDSNVISAIATLTWDCRRSDFFRPHLIGGLKLVDRGSISASTVGAKHGEWGHTQFLLGNALKYGVDGNGDGKVDLGNLTDALATTANYLATRGWRAGAGYQEGEPNFAVIKEWNAATVYQQAIAIIGGRIDG